MTDTKEQRKILLVGRTGNGKSSLANAISNTEEFKVGHYGRSETKKHQIGRWEIDDIEFVIIDTIGIGDTNLTEIQVLNKIADACYEVRDGLHQVVFVTSSRFTEEEILAYELLMTVVFNSQIVSYTTIVRTKFGYFRDPAMCDEDIRVMKKENGKLASVITNCNKVIHVNNLTKIEDPSQTNTKDSRAKLLMHLRNCREIYRPKELDTLNDRLKEYVPEKQKLQQEIDKISKLLIETGNNNKQLQELLSRKEREYNKKLEEMAKVMGGTVRERNPGLLGWIGGLLDSVHPIPGPGKCTIQ